MSIFSALRYVITCKKGEDIIDLGMCIAFSLQTYLCVFPWTFISIAGQINNPTLPTRNSSAKSPVTFCNQHILSKTHFIVMLSQA